MSKEWAEIKGYEGLYEVSTKGLVRNMKTGFLKKNTETRGYYVSALSKEGKSKNMRVHRIVAEAFIPNPYEHPQVNHIDGDKSNNCVENLEWVTNQQNLDHAYSLGIGMVPKEVIQMMNGIEVAKYKSIAQAGKSVGSNPLDISNACKGRYRRWKGYEWKFA